MFIDKLKKESPEESIKNLNSPEGYDYYTPSDRKFEQFDLERIYSNRRFWKVESELAGRPGKNSSLTYEKTFEEIFSNLKETYDTD
jgi:hypothetical protein